MIKRLSWSWGVFVLTLALSIGTIMVVDPSLQIPMHWNAAGEVDRTSTPVPGLLIVPAVQLVMMLIFSSLKALEPRQENLEASIKAFKAVIFAAVALPLFGQLVIIDKALNLGWLSQNFIFTGVGLMLMVMGNYFGKLRSSFFIGIRTPWTLSSETVWQKTHRLGGKLFVAAGLLVVIGSLLVEPNHLIALVLLGVLPAALIPAIYSWVLWRKEQSV